MNPEPDTLTVSVTELARVMGASGDLKRRDFSLLRGVEGIRVHQRMQKNRGSGFEAEKPVQTLWKDLRIQGRVDGVSTEGGRTELEEIKTSLDPERDAADPDPRHLFQLRVYGWIWEIETGRMPGMKLMYVHPKGDAVQVPVEPLPGLEEQIDRYRRLCRERKAWTEKRNRALCELPFPFPDFRAGQTDMIEEVKDALSSGEQLILEAPTGMGKTISVVYPVLQALGRGDCRKVFLATCRNTGKNALEDTLACLAESLPGLRSLTLQARDRVCREVGTPCDCGRCPRALGFYDRLDEGLEDLRKEKLWDAATWRRVADAHQLCPFAFSMAAAREADILIGDINYALDPAARLEGWWRECSGETVLVVDEAHHLPERVRGMLSASLNPSSLRKALREMSPEHRAVCRKDIHRVIRETQAYLRDAVEENGWPREESPPPQRLAGLCSGALDALEVSLADAPPREGDPRVTLFRELSAFRMAVQISDKDHVAYGEDRSLFWYCRNPGEWIRGQVETCAASVLFSATLAPMEAYRELTGLGPGTRERIFASPFPADHFQVKLQTSFSLAYRDRTPDTLFRLSEWIQARLSEDRKNTLVFFPSYALMTEVFSRMPPADLVMGPVRMQPRGLQEEEARKFLEPFFHDPHAGAVFAVLGGPLNEGIDLPGQALTRVIVISIGLPAVCMEREILRDGYQRRGLDGFRMAYELPGLIQLRQALGRVIRGPEDRGEAFLVDARYQRDLYRRLLPSEAANFN